MLPVLLPVLLPVPLLVLVLLLVLLLLFDPAVQLRLHGLHADAAPTCR